MATLSCHLNPESLAIFGKLNLESLALEVKVKDIEEILRYFPNQIYSLLKNTLTQDINLQKDLQEIRIRVGRPILLKMRQADVIIDYKINTSEVLQILEKLCENSIYAYKNQICDGFLTVKGGHRIRYNGNCCYGRRKGVEFEVYN